MVQETNGDEERQEEQKIYFGTRIFGELIQDGIDEELEQRLAKLYGAGDKEIAANDPIKAGEDVIDEEEQQHPANQVQLIQAVAIFIFNEIARQNQEGGDAKEPVQGQQPFFGFYPTDQPYRQLDKTALSDKTFLPGKGFCIHPVSLSRTENMGFTR
jgi:hypothetical protein